jgi:spermidine/putrescine-binding protein
VRRSASLGASTALVALAIGACGDPHRQPAAAEEPVLNIYNWADYIGHDTIAEFERQTHIKVVYGLYDSNETLEAKILTGRSGYDLVSTTTAFYGRQIKAGAYLDLDRTRLPNWKNLDPAVLEVQAQADPGNRHAVPYLHAMNGIWSSDYEVAQQRAREDRTGARLAFILPKEGSNITYNAFLIPASAPHPQAAHAFLNFILDAHVIAEITNDIRYGNDNLAARPFVHPDILDDPAVYPSADLRSRLYMPVEVSGEYERLRTRTWTRIKTGQ